LRLAKGPWTALQEELEAFLRGRGKGGMRAMVRHRRSGLQDGQTVAVEGADDVAYGLIAALQLRGNGTGRLLARTRQHDLTAAEREGVVRPQARLERGAFLVGERTHEDWS
jgi:hypothetical protein